MDLESLRQKLAKTSQEQVLRFASQLSPAQKQKLAGQLSALDLNHISQLAQEYVRNKPHVALPNDIQPVKAYPRNAGPEQQKLYVDAEKRGWELLNAGKVGAFLV